MRWNGGTPRLERGKPTQAEEACQGRGDAILGCGAGAWTILSPPAEALLCGRSIAVLVFIYNFLLAVFYTPGKGHRQAPFIGGDGV